MNSVVQKDDYGCGVACVANILNLSYKDTVLLFNNGKMRAESEGFYCKEIVSVLNSRGLNYDFKYIKPKLRRKIYRSGVIVFIKRSRCYPAGHYLNRKMGYWQDSWINFPKASRKAGIRKRLPGKPIYMIFPV